MAVATKKKTPPATPAITWPFGKKNYLVFGAAVVVIALGYIALAMGSITLAPLLLVMGYCILIPVALLIRPERESDEATTSAPSEKSDSTREA
ncbi:MAG TPA: hypothetical protein VN285_01530 [Candidatus Deferrimicrobium sp.]|nr:hypothetical protein [Candidatus Deferrimicrobium sp.]